MHIKISNPIEPTTIKLETPVNGLLTENSNEETEDDGKLAPLSSNATTTTTSMIQMQNSTDTLVDEALLSRKLAAAVMITSQKNTTGLAKLGSNGSNGSNGDGETSTGGTLSPATAPDYPTIDDDLSRAMNNQISHQQPLSVATTTNSSATSESSTPSTIPSPTLSTNGGRSCVSQYPNESCRIVSNKVVTSSSVSTSTSGLFDYVNHTPR